MNYAKEAWQEELISWQTVIQLNLTRNVNTLVDLLSEEMTTPTVVNEDEPYDSDDESSTHRPHPSSSSARRGSNLPLKFTEKHRMLQLQLRPLRTVQVDLEERLGASSLEEKPGSSADAPAEAPSPTRTTRPQEAFVRSNNSWKLSLKPGRRSGEGRAKKTKETQARETADILYGCSDAMKSLWEDETVQEMLRRRKVRLDTMPGL